MASKTRANKDGKQIILKTAAFLTAIILSFNPMIPSAVYAASSEDKDISQSIDFSEISNKEANLNQLLVVTENNISKRGVGVIAKKAGGKIESYSQLDEDNFVASIKVEPEDINEIATELERDPSVVFVQPNYRYSLETGENEDQNVSEDDIAQPETEQITSDPESPDAQPKQKSTEENQSSVSSDNTSDKLSENRLYTSAQWHLADKNVYPGAANIDSALKEIKNNNKVTVAVIDSGADLSHPDLKGVIQKDKCVTFYCGEKGSFTQWDKADDDMGHGTHIAGLIAANGTNVTGAAKDKASLICIDVAAPDGGLYTYDIVMGINYAVSQGAKVINLSLGGAYTDILTDRAIENAWNNGVLCVCAAGNDASNKYICPSDSGCAVSVMSVDKNGKKMSSSNYGAEKDICAPGQNMYSTWIDDGFESQSGTSMAAPIVTSAAALLLSEDPTLKPRELKNLLYSGTGKTVFSAAKSGDGFGNLDAKASLDTLRSSSQNPAQIELNKTEIKMAKGEMTSLDFCVYPASASRLSDTVFYESTNPKVASVNRNGFIYALSEGETDIVLYCKGATAKAHLIVETGSNASPSNNTNTSGTHVHSLKKIEAVKAQCGKKGCDEYYECTGCHRIFSDPDGKKEIDHIPETAALSHDWGAPEYKWNEDYTKITATRTCKRDPSHKETETVFVSSEFVKASVCGKKGEIKYISNKFENPAFTTQTKTVTVPAIDHKWGKTSYEWSSNNKKVTATRRCTRDSSHKETETVAATSTIIVEATCREKGKIEYVTEEFENKGFSKQTKTVNTKALGHDWSDTVYEWSDDLTSVTASRYCKRDPEHKETETVKATSWVSQKPTTEKEGVTGYISDAFKNKDFEIQTKAVRNIRKLTLQEAKEKAEKKAAKKKTVIKDSSMPVIENIRIKVYKKGFKLKWKKIPAKKQRYVGRVQIQYGTNRAFKNAKSKTIVKSNESTTVTGLKARKVYYIRMRNYKNDDDYRYVSSWSEPIRIFTR